MKWLSDLSQLSRQARTPKQTNTTNIILTSQRNTSLAKATVCSAVVLLMAGCASKPVVNPGQSRLIVIPQYYTVKAGDTLSQIAARYNLDYREIARINNIDSSYIIYTNQSLRLHHGGKDAPRIQVKTSATPAPVSIQAKTLPVQQTTVQQPVRARPQPATSPVRQIPATNTPPILPNTPTILPAGLSWQWPANGPVLQQFDLAGDIKGIRIGGNTGDTIKAAADGEVVYASDRLTEYGNLVLIRHTNGYVTAYAHNSKMIIKEGDRVKAGQKIAEMGSSGTTQTMLEFQVRLNGKPINPASLLPAR